MIPERAALLAELLREMRETDGDRIPDQAWHEVQKTFALPYVEILLVRESGRSREVFLTRRGSDDPHWPGRPWHIPGGMWRTSRQLLEACRDVAAGELDVQVTACRELFTCKWSDHPYGHPISHVCLCDVATPPRPSDDGQYFPLTTLPEPLLVRHREFLDRLSRLSDLTV
ncbi:MAG: NUDIX domain-containing protein [Vicinamibacterales bacterium]